MLKVLPPVVSVKRETLYIVAQKWEGGIWLKSAASCGLQAARLGTVAAGGTSSAPGWDLAAGAGVVMVVWAWRRRPAFRRSGAGHALIEDAQCALDGGPSCLSVLRVRWCEWNVNVFEDGARSDAAKTQRRFDQVVARQAGVFAAQSVSEKERFGELTSVHEETRAVDGP